MKRIPCSGAIALAASISLLSAQQKQQMRDAATHEQLAGALKQQQANDPLRELPRQEGKDPSKENVPQDLISRSDVLCFNGLATLVPKKSILALPPQFADRVGMQPGARLVGWAEFHAANRGWVTSQEITLAQARGEQPLEEALNERLAKSANVVVSTLQGGPISKLQPIPPKTN
ncbi:hypothetical protein OVA24_09465 [Luteolibacter sp. SL250]|uniref:hypothetical protein n=1 Tax=Luteolibacter sp. SL250 TaxID=2995170 RepID=UPI002270656E|nr:hypothetical protein [Luteolibacter sp. SL250]WAC21611.1 hypothetical protein OVA24_09465 [Luteolibacter sp. SL250]